MKWFPNFFKKKSSEYYSDKSDLEWDAFICYARGEKYFLESKFEEALEFFDNALEKGFKKKDIFEFRGICLQSLGYEFDAIEDFNKAILISPDNCHLYYHRALSKDAIFNYQGEVEDIEKAIELSKKDTSLNIQYTKDAVINGYQNGIIGMYEITLFRAKSRLEFEIKEREKRNEEKLKHIKRR